MNPDDDIDSKKPKSPGFMIEWLVFAVYLGSLLIFSLSHTRLLGFGFLWMGSAAVLAILLFLRSSFVALLFLFFSLFIVSPQLATATQIRLQATQLSVRNDLVQIATAMQEYHKKHGRFPAQAVYGPDGKALYSWRVELLPYLEEDHLYRRFRLDEPWDSPENIKLLPSMPRLYRGKCHETLEREPQTHYQVFVGPGAAFEGTSGLSLDRDFPGGAEQTILVVETFEPVPWSKPVDIPFEAGKALPLMGEYGANRLTRWWYWEPKPVPPPIFLAGLANGSVQWFANPPDPKELRRWITRKGEEPRRSE